jgi:hypothetical protein
MKVVEYFSTFLTNSFLHFPLIILGVMSFVSWLSVIIGSRIQLTLSVLGGSLIFLRGRIYLRLHGRCCSMYLDLSKECLNTEFGVAVCEL